MKTIRNHLALLLSAAAIATAPAARALDFTAQGEYMGSSDCRPCHGRFYKLWSTSHHGKAMQAFSADFTKTLKPMEKPIEINGSSFIVEFNGHGGELRETRPDGSTRTYPILHAMGGKNVYFFLVPLDRGRLQTAPVAYNVHTKTWYNSTASMVRHFNNGIHDEALEWTDRQLTFNTACHDCHISQLRKNYDPKTDSYHTTWQEAGINCETCHGPAEAHIKAAREAQAKGEKLTDVKLLRFHQDLNARQRDAACSPCHAKMVPLTRDFTPGELFFDHYDLTSYEDPDFFPDGRDLGENYTMTGWAANPCANSGQLECIHCHTSSGRFRFKDNPNQACLPCHKKRVENIVAHSHHPASAGLTCIDCHMPMTAQGYMRRSDHSFRPPSPAASLAFGSPNACNLCHNDPDAITGPFTGHSKKDMEWAAKHVREWFGEDSGTNILRQGYIIQACRSNDWERLPEITACLASPASDPPTKVAILRLLGTCPSPDKWPAIREQLGSTNAWVRSAAAAALQYDPSPESTELLLKAAADRFRTVRIRAAASLLGRDLSGYSGQQRKAYEKAHSEYWNSLVIWPDRWSTHYNQGIYFDRLNQPQKAIKAYEKAMELRGDVIQPMLNCSMDYARTGNSTNAYALLKKAVATQPKSPLANFNLALIEAELGKLDDCETHLRAALDTDPNMARAAYNLGVLLCRAGKEEGFQWLETATRLDPANWDYLSSLIFFLQRDGRAPEAEAALKQAVAGGYAPPEAYFALVNDYMNAGRVDEALEICRKAKTAPRLPPDARRYAAQLEQQIKQHQN